MKCEMSAEMWCSRQSQEYLNAECHINVKETAQCSPKHVYVCFYHSAITGEAEQEQT